MKPDQSTNSGSGLDDDFSPKPNEQLLKLGVVNIKQKMIQQQRGPFFTTNVFRTSLQQTHLPKLSPFCTQTLVCSTFYLLRCLPRA